MRDLRSWAILAKRRAQLAILAAALGFGATTGVGGGANVATARDSAGTERALAVVSKESETCGALLVGVDQYASKSVSSLQYACSDVRKIGDALIEIDFPAKNIRTLVGDRPTRAAILAALDELLAKSGPNSTVLVVFSGHGFETPDGRSAFCPEDVAVELAADGRPTVSADSAILLDEIAERLRRDDARFKLLIVDACRESASISRNALATPRSFSSVDASGLAFLQSCGSSEFSWEHSELDGGVFSAFFSEGLRGAADSDGDGGVTFWEVCERASRETQRFTKKNCATVQTPFFTFSGVSDFYLTPPRSGRGGSGGWGWLPFALLTLTGGAVVFAVWTERKRRRTAEALATATGGGTFATQSAVATPEAPSVGRPSATDFSFDESDAEDASRKAREASERADAERRAREETERQVREAERRAQEAEARAASERKAREAAENERKAREEAERQVREAERRAQEAEERAASERKAREAEERAATERRAREEAERKAREAEERAATERRAREEAERKASVAAQTSLPEDYLAASGIKFRLIRPGSFMMGNTLTPEEIHKKYPGVELEWYQIAPPHKVTLTKPFYLAKYATTVGEFKRFVDATGYKTTAEREGNARGFKKAGWWDEWWDDVAGWWGDVAGLNWRNPGIKQDSTHPVVCVSWDDAQRYIAWLNENAEYSSELGFKPVYRLPSEAEWEYACRAGTETEFFWGTNEPADGEGCLNAADKTGMPNGGKWSYPFPFKSGYKATSPVGKFKPNGWGLYDMLGNVWEWCADWYDGKYYEKTNNAQNPINETPGSHRVLRGGSWSNYAGYCRSAYRGICGPTDRCTTYGFRLALGREL